MPSSPGQEQSLPTPPPPPLSPQPSTREAGLKQSLLARIQRPTSVNNSNAPQETPATLAAASEYSIQRGDAGGNVAPPQPAPLHPSLPMKPVGALSSSRPSSMRHINSSRDTYRGRELLSSTQGENDSIRLRPRSQRASAHEDGREDEERARLRAPHDHNTYQPLTLDDDHRETSRRQENSNWREAPPHSRRSADATSRMRYSPLPPRRDTYRPGPGDDSRDNRSGLRQRPDNQPHRRERDPPDADGRPGPGLGREQAAPLEDKGSPQHGPNSLNRAHRTDLSLPPPPHAMPPFRPTNPPSGRPYTAGSGNAIAGPTNLDQRRELRESTEVNIWPASPKRPYSDEIKDLESKSRRSKSSKSSRRKRRYTSETESDSEAEYERERRHARRRDRERKRERRSRRSPSEADSRRGRDTPKAEAVVPAGVGVGTADDGPEVGPQPPTELSLRTPADRDAYRALLPGEGAAMAAFVAKGERIPRRGEVGMDPKQIQAYEDAGYVMSGSRHARMNAVRLRKEGQVINAEEKRAMLKQSREEWIEKEGAIISQFKEMMDERLQMEEKRARERGGGKGKDGR